MGLKDHRYRVTLLRVCRTDSGMEVDMSEAMDYHELDYGQMVTLETIIRRYADAISEELIELGVHQALMAGMAVDPELEKLPKVPKLPRLPRKKRAPRPGKKKVVVKKSPVKR